MLGGFERAMLATQLMSVLLKLFDYHNSWCTKLVVSLRKFRDRVGHISLALTFPVTGAVSYQVWA
jgi:hypothetical protein